MAPSRLVIPAHLSVAQIKRILVFRERLEKLETRKENLEKEIAKAEKDLTTLLRGTSLRAKARKKAKRKSVKKRVVKKKRRKVARKKARPIARKKAKRPVRKIAKRAAKKTTKKTTRKKTRRKAVKKAGRIKRAAAPKAKKTLEHVVADLIRSRGKPLAFQDILATIQKKKLFQTKSKNFDNVLRRTLSTSKKVKRVGRGIYGVA